tara:strand:- start:2378 stop:2641 length:264 start_codon:yes stop_codon:yes gene_type:complete
MRHAACGEAPGRISTSSALQIAFAKAATWVPVDGFYWPNPTFVADVSAALMPQLSAPKASRHAQLQSFPVVMSHLDDHPIRAENSGS